MANTKIVWTTIQKVQEPLLLVGNNEWLEQWDTTHERLNLGDIVQNIEDDVMDNYFQQSIENIGYETKEVWHLA
jgi:hypothetical protein